MNKIREEKKARAPRPATGLVKTLSDLVNGNFLVKGQVTRHLPFFFFLILLTLVYIGNGYYAEDMVRELNKIAGDMKEMRSEYISTKSELMFRSKQSEVARLLEPYGVKESVVPPVKIKPASANHAE